MNIATDIKKEKYLLDQSNHPRSFIEKDGERILRTWEDDTAKWTAFMKFTKNLKTVNVTIDDKINMIGENA